MSGIHDELARRQASFDRRTLLGKAAVTGGSLLLPASLGGLFPAGAAAAATRQRHADAASSTIYVALGSDMTNIDPFLTNNDNATAETLTNVYGLPMNFKIPGPPVDNVPAANANVFAPWLASSWKWNAKRSAVTFEIPAGRKFADGTPLDANAVKFSWDRCFDVQGSGYFLFSMVGVTKKSQLRLIDSHHIEVVMPHESSLLFGNMAQFYSTAIVNPTIVKKHATSKDPHAKEWMKTHTADSGPYYLKQWQVGTGWTLEANPYSPIKAKTKTVIFQVVPDASQRELLLRSGKVDFVPVAWTPVKDVPRLQKASGIKVVSLPSRYVVFAGMNVAHKPFDNKLVRQAFNYAVPYDTIMAQVMHGQGVQLKSPVPQGTPTSDFSFWHYQTNIAKAKDLLKQAGFSKGLSVELSINVGASTDQDTAIWIQQGLQQIGVGCTIKKLPGSAYSAASQARSLPFFINSSWVSNNNDPFYHLYWLFTQDCCTYGRYINPEVVKLVSKWVNQPPSAQRDAASKQIQKLIVDDAPWIFLYQPPNIYLMGEHVQGFTYEPADNVTRYWTLSKT
jgi:peptide/nickel transport system substrate-binding protein